jgi:hypothetical protein
MPECWLLVARCYNLDVPLRLFASREDAVEYAASLTFADVYNAEWAAFRPMIRDLPEEPEPEDFVCLTVVRFTAGSPEFDGMVRSTVLADDNQPAAEDDYEEEEDGEFDAAEFDEEVAK